MPNEYGNIYASYIEKNGSDSTILKAVEELSELSHALMHFRKSKATEDEVIKEIVDVQIECEKLSILFNKNKIEDYRKIKLEKISKKL